MKYLFFVMYFALSGCSIKKKSSVLKESENYHRESFKNASWNADEKLKLENVNDSSAIKHTLIIYPKGKFSLSSKGFEGEASHLTYSSEQLQKHINQSVAHQIRQDYHADQIEKVQQQAEKTSTQGKWFFSFGNWVVYLIGALLVFWYFKRLAGNIFKKALK